MKNSMNFEEYIKELEDIVEKLEKGDMTLDESLESFKKGIELSKYCSKILDNTEQKINKLIKEKNGEIRVETFEINEKE